MLQKQRKKILFINLPGFNIDDYITGNITARAPVFAVPYGILSIISYAKSYSQHDIQAEVMDLNVEVFRFCTNAKDTDVKKKIEECIVEKISSMQPDIIAISAQFINCYSYIGFITDAIKQAYANGLVVIGGGLATNLYGEVLDKFPSIDAAGYGEGEIPICELIDAEDINEYFKGSVSWITRSSLQKGQIPQSSFVQNLDAIEFFDYNLIDIDEYSYSGRAIDRQSNYQDMREMSIHTSRGCPFNCVFCASNQVHGKKIRFMSADKVIDEVQRMIDIYDMKVLLVEDDHFFSDKLRAKKILKKLSEYNIRIEFPSSAAVYPIDAEIGELLKKAGNRVITLSVESGSDYVLQNIIDKPLRTNMVKGAVDILRQNGICVHANFIIGFPGELEQHRQETMQMIATAKFDWVNVFIATPLIGSRLYRICQENGYLINDDVSQYIVTKCNIKAPGIDPAYIEDQAYLMNLEVNFVRSHSLNTGDFQKALLHFSNVAQRYPDHAFAHYCLAITYEGLGQESQGKYHNNRFRELVNTSTTWARYAQIFNLQIKENIRKDVEMTGEQ